MARKLSTTDKVAVGGLTGLLVIASILLTILSYAIPVVIIVEVLRYMGVL